MDGDLASGGAKLARLLNVGINLSSEGGDSREPLFGSEISDKSHFNIFAINIVVEIKKMDFQDPI
jgi:hypothetical protein